MNRKRSPAQTAGGPSGRSRSIPEAAGPHLGLEELLELRDGRGTGAAQEHVEDCVTCRDELEGLYQVRSHLRALPSLSPPRDRWPELRRTIVSERRQRRSRRLFLGSIAAAALALLATGIVRQLDQRAEERQRNALEAQISDLKEQSQLLDAEVRALSRRATKGWQAEVLVDLEDRLDVVDDALEQLAGDERQAVPVPQAELELWAQRLELQSSMIRVHFTPVAYHGL